MELFVIAGVIALIALGSRGSPGRPGAPSSADVEDVDGVRTFTAQGRQRVMAHLAGRHLESLNMPGQFAMVVSEDDEGPDAITFVEGVAADGLAVLASDSLLVAPEAGALIATSIAEAADLAHPGADLARLR